MKKDEREFLDELQRSAAANEHPYVREIAEELGIHEKRAAFICDKWEKKGWYAYGVNILAGWLTPAGMIV